MVDNQPHTNPFPGLRSFTENEGHLFFGRDEQVADLIQKFQKSRFVSVIGSAGSGKSSLIKAGLIPALYEGKLCEAGSNWKIVSCRIGNNPVGNLSKAFVDVLSIRKEFDLEVETFEAKIRNTRNGLYDALKEITWEENENILVVVDQFEEIFRFDLIERNKKHVQRDSNFFISQLINASEKEDIRLFVLLSIRSEYLGESTLFRGLPEAINEGHYLIPRMGRKERKAAVEKPIKAVGAKINPELTDLVLNDTGLSPDHLSILQHALMRTWNYWKQNNNGEPVDIAHYKAIGGMSKALSIHAEEVYSELITDRQHHICEVLFKTLCANTNNTDLIHPANTLENIARIAECSESEVIEVIDIFRQPEHSFLVPPISVPLDKDTAITLTHDGLARLWTRLAKWHDEEHQAADLYVRLSRAAALYQEGKSALWRDPELQVAIQWRENQCPNSQWAERYDVSFERAMVFLNYSQEQQKFRIEQKQKQQKQQLKRAKIFTIIVSIIGLLAIISTIYALIQRTASEINAQKAEEQAKEAKFNQDIAMVIAEASEKKESAEHENKKDVKYLYFELRTKHDSLNHRYQQLSQKQRYSSTKDDSLNRQIIALQQRLKRIENLLSQINVLLKE